MSKFICISDSKEHFDVNNVSLGMNGERALYYCKRLHRKRTYRLSYPSKQFDMALFVYKSKSKAQKLCDEINKAYNDDFYPKDIE